MLSFRLSVRTSYFSTLAKQNKCQAKIIFTTGETGGLAEWIIDDTCHIEIFRIIKFLFNWDMVWFLDNIYMPLTINLNFFLWENKMQNMINYSVLILGWPGFHLICNLKYCNLNPVFAGFPLWNSLINFPAMYDVIRFLNFFR